MRLISWNVNGLRAVLKKNFIDVFNQLDADVFCIQETKLQDHQLEDTVRNIPGYASHWAHSSVKKGYSGVGTWTRVSPRSVRGGIGIPEFDDEGRILELDFGTFVLFNVYFPNGQMSDERLQYKLRFYKSFFDYVNSLKEGGRSLVITGDYNTAHNEIDLKNPKANADRSGFLRIERDWLDAIVEAGYVDTFRHFYPDEVKYSWWSYRFKARERNAGWRIDYFFVSRDMIDDGRVKEAFIANDIYGSDHCPVGLTIDDGTKNGN
ncbi:MAG: exodeoxyribonuclease III [Thermodesulfobacteriota bacterium]|nr:exodeoxyribonuclease III [Thermodesulfobacteriota bacterium]